MNERNVRKELGREAKTRLINNTLRMLLCIHNPVFYDNSGIT